MSALLFTNDPQKGNAAKPRPFSLTLPLFELYTLFLIAVATFLNHFIRTEISDGWSSRHQDDLLTWDNGPIETRQVSKLDDGNYVFHGDSILVLLDTMVKANQREIGILMTSWQDRPNVVITAPKSVNLSINPKSFCAITACRTPHGAAGTFMIQTNPIQAAFKVKQCLISSNQGQMRSTQTTSIEQVIQEKTEAVDLDKSPFPIIKKFGGILFKISVIGIHPQTRRLGLFNIWPNLDKSEGPPTDDVMCSTLFHEVCMGQSNHLPVTLFYSFEGP